MTLQDSDGRQQAQPNYSALVYEILAGHVRAFVRNMRMPLQTSVTLVVTWLWHRNVMLAEMVTEGQEQRADMVKLLQETNMCLDAMERDIFGDRLPAWLRVMPSLVEEQERWTELALHFDTSPPLQVDVHLLLGCLIY